MGRYLERIKQSPVGRFYAKYTEDRADEGAILIAWQALFSLFPMIVGMFAILGLVVRNEEARGAVTDAVAGAFPEQAGDLVSFIEETREIGGPLAAVSLIGLLWTGSALFGQMATVFNRFYDAEERGFIGQRLMAFMMMAVYLVLIVVSVGANGAGHAIADLAEWFLGYPLQGIAAFVGLVIGWIISVGSAFLMFLVLYRVVPNTGLGFRQVWRGALLAAVLFLLLNQIFPIYLQFFGGGFATYKTLGLFLLLMTWFFFLTRILVLGSELNAFLTGHGSREAAMPGVPAGGRGKKGAAAHRARAAGANGRAEVPAAGKQILWAALSAGVTGLVLAGAQRTAAGAWRAIMREEPPGKSG
jgi:membrane protein